MMGLFKELATTYKKWNRDRTRSSFLYCPVCRHDLNVEDILYMVKKLK